MRRVIPVLALLLSCAVGRNAAAQTPAAAPQGLSYVEAVADPQSSVGKTVTWTVRFRNFEAQIGRDGSVTDPRMLFEARGPQGWSGRWLIVPASPKWSPAAGALRGPTIGEHALVITGRITGFETSRGTDGKPIQVPVLSDVAIDAAPATVVESGFGAGAYTPGQGVTWPVVVREVKPKYPEGAMGAKIQGQVELQIVVSDTGTVGDVRVIKSLDRQFGLDDAAIAAAKQWQFRPGLRDGRTVPTIVSLILEFRVGKDR